MPTISEIVDVSISVQSSAVAEAGFNSLILVGDGDAGGNSGVNFNALWANHEVKPFTSFEALAADPGIKPNSNIIKMAQVAFAQVPSVPTVYVSRIDRGTPAEQVSTLTYLTIPFESGQSISVDIDGVAIAASPIDFITDHDTTMAAIASAIAAEAGVATAVASGEVGFEDVITITGAAAGDSFLVTSEVLTGAVVDEAVTQEITTPAVNFISATDITDILANSDAWFGYAHDFTNNADAETAAGALAATKKYGGFIYTSISAPPNLNTNFSFLQFVTSADPLGQWTQVAWLSAMLGRTVGSYNPAHMSLELVDIVSLSSAQETTLRADNANQYSKTAGLDLTYDGKAANGGFIDTFINVLFLEARIQERVFGLLASSDKVPYDDGGISSVAASVSSVLQLAEDQGILLPIPKFQITIPSAASISPIDKSNRVLNGISFVAFAGSGVNTVQINGVLVD